MPSYQKFTYHVLKQIENVVQLKIELFVYALISQHIKNFRLYPPLVAHSHHKILSMYKKTHIKNEL